MNNPLSLFLALKFKLQMNQDLILIPGSWFLILLVISCGL